MKISNPKISQVTRDRHFGRIEAWVSFDMQYHPSLPARRETVLASAVSYSKDLRTRLLRDARRVAVLLHRSDRKESMRPNLILAA